MVKHTKSDPKGHVEVSFNDHDKTFSMRIFSFSPLVEDDRTGTFEITGSVEGTSETIQLFGENIFSQHMVAGAREDFGGIEGGSASAHLRAGFLSKAFRMLSAILKENNHDNTERWDAVAYAFENAQASVRTHEHLNKLTSPTDKVFKDRIIERALRSGQPSRVPLQLPSFINAVQDDFEAALVETLEKVDQGQSVEELRRSRFKSKGSFRE
ncbi:MAG: hypothetical protein U1E36_03555 [Rickettsiales bacterium]